MKRVVGYLPILLLVLSLGIFARVMSLNEPPMYLPVVMNPPTPTPLPTATPTPIPPPSNDEFRGLWVTRFDWSGNRTPSKIDEIVNNAAYAGFNVIFFQVRGEADAFYNSNVEPWSALLTGTLGQHPGWDPLAYMISKAHQRGIQVHAYFNVYPVWLGCSAPPAGTNPPHLYYILQSYGTTGGKINHLQWNTAGQVVCANSPSSEYQRASPASIDFDNHLMAVASDLVTNYDIDGLHLDHIRYAGNKTSCDPISAFRYGRSCIGDTNLSSDYADWQRVQVNGTVELLYNQIVPLRPKLWLSAAVWPQYIDYWNWGGLEGYHDYYQDSKAWVAGDYIDSISPMIYGSSFWTQSKWQILVQDFHNSRSGRYVIPGIGAHSSDFGEVLARINMARSIGTAGHAIFSYSYVRNNGFFDDLANGPYAIPATVPDIPWHN